MIICRVSRCGCQRPQIQITVNHHWDRKRIDCTIRKKSVLCVIQRLQVAYQRKQQAEKAQSAHHRQQAPFKRANAFLAGEDEIRRDGWLGQAAISLTSESPDELSRWLDEAEQRRYRHRPEPSLGIAVQLRRFSWDAKVDESLPDLEPR